MGIFHSICIVYMLAIYYVNKASVNTKNSAQTYSSAKIMYAFTVLATANPNHRQVNVGTPTEQPERTT